MKKILFALALISSVALSGCVYAPNDDGGFVVKKCEQSNLKEFKFRYVISNKIGPDFEVYLNSRFNVGETVYIGTKN